VIRLRNDFTQRDRDHILEELRRQGIGCNNYFSPIHLQPFMVEQFGYKPGDFPVTEQVSQRTIALPFCNNLTREQAEMVCKTLESALDKIKK
jgi:perosamine synthetase